MAINRAAYELRRKGLSQDSIAREVGVSRVSVSNWLNGSKRPAPPMREKIRDAYGIEPASWDEERGRAKPSEAAPSPPPPIVTPAPVASSTPDSVLEKAANLESRAERLLSDLDDDVEATPLERAKVMNSVAQTLALIAKLTGQFDLGARVFRLPIWREIERALERGLSGHPDAAKAVAAELRRVETDSGYKRP